MKLDKNTFCAAAWFQVRNEHSDNNYRVCCEIQPSESEFSGERFLKWPDNTPKDFLNSEYTQYIRKKLNDGKRIPECYRCWKKEDSGGKSLRQTSNDTVTNNHGYDLDNTWVKNYFKNKKDFISDILISADIKTSNLCNFSCIMCNPMDSSKLYTKWQKNKDNPAIQTLLKNEKPDYLANVKRVYMDKNTRHSLLKSFLNLKPKHVKILGGEPLMDEKSLEILENFKEKSKVKLLFVTNGSKNLVQISERFKNYKDVNYTISLDGNSSIQDYIREGSDWKHIEKNVLDYKQKYPNNKLSVNCTVQALNVYHLPELIDWCKLNAIALNFSLLSEPYHMSMASIPPELKTIMINNISPVNLHIEKVAEYENSYQLVDIKKLLLETEFNEQALEDLKEYIRWYDPHQKWKNVIPEWKPYLE